MSQPTVWEPGSSRQRTALNRRVTTDLDATTISSRRRWSMLAASTLAQGSASIMVNGPAFLIPSLIKDEGLSLTRAGVVAAAALAGATVALIAWGVVTDRFGERFALLVGLTGTTTAGVVATQSGTPVLLALVLVVGGVFSASTGAATGRVVVGWFPPRRRGLAMGIRQTAQPLGVGIGAAVMPLTADRVGPYAAMWVPTVTCAVALALVAVLVVDPPRPASGPAAAPNPYRGDSFLPRIHAVSVLLVIPQFVVWTFALVWLIQDRGWSPGAAGGVVAIAQVTGIAGRIAAGQISDLVGSRMRPLRWVTWLAAGVMVTLGVTAGQDWAVAVPLVVLATMITVADNGLAFTAVAERAGPFWSGRALGLQNTAQYLTASISAPVGAYAVTQSGYPAVFAGVAVFPLLAIALVPVTAENPLA
jgi:sugar phosphate permease